MNNAQLTIYKQTADKALKWLTHQLKEDGSFQVPLEDLACYYKAPYLFSLSGQLGEANRILNFIQKSFGQNDGDFKTSPNLKSENGNFIEYRAYMNGWIALAAQKMGRFDLAYPAYAYLQTFYHPKHGGFTTQNPYQQDGNVLDALTTAHLGLVALYMGELSKARTAGHLLESFLFLQPDQQNGFYLRIKENGELIMDYPEETAMFFQVTASQPNQAYFMLGYPIAFLGKLFLATRDARFIDTAEAYLEFLLSCRGNLATFHYSHKVAWGAAILARITRDQRYVDLATTLADFFVETQNHDGKWLQDEPPLIYFDQTAEIAIWLIEISSELVDC